MIKSSSAAHLHVYTVREFENAAGEKAKSWTRVGVAFPHKDKPGFNLELQALPLDGRLVALLPREAERNGAAAAD